MSKQNVRWESAARRAIRAASMSASLMVIGALIEPANARQNNADHVKNYFWGPAASEEICSALRQVAEASKADFSDLRGKPDDMASSENPSWESLFLLPGARDCSVSWYEFTRENSFTCYFNMPSVASDLTELSTDSGWLAAQAGFASIRDQVSACGEFTETKFEPGPSSGTKAGARVYWVSRDSGTKLQLRLFVGAASSRPQMALDYKAPDSFHQRVGSQ